MVSGTTKWLLFLQVFFLLIIFFAPEEIYNRSAAIVNFGFVLSLLGHIGISWSYDTQTQDFYKELHLANMKKEDNDNG